MAVKVGELYADLDLNDRGFHTRMDMAERRAGTFGTAMRRGLGAAARATAVGMGAAAVAVGAFVKTAVEGAADVGESVSKATVIFEKNSASVLKWSDQTGSAFGISKAGALDAAAAYGAMFKTAGLTSDQMAKMSTKTVELGADLASMFNQDPTEMLDKLRSGLAGEAEPLRQFGVFISEARVQEEAFRMGIAKEGEVLTEAQKVLARYNVIMKDTKVAHGDFARTADSLPNQMRALRAEWTDLTAEVGAKFLPVATDIVSWAREKLPDAIDWLSGKIDELWPKIEPLARTLGGAFVDAGKELAPMLPDIADALGRMAEAAVPLVGPMSKIAGTFVKIGVEVAAEAFEVFASVMEALLPVLEAVADAIDSMPDDLKKIVGVLLLLRGVGGIGRGGGGIPGALPFLPFLGRGRAPVPTGGAPAAGGGGLIGGALRFAKGHPLLTLGAIGGAAALKQGADVAKEHRKILEDGRANVHKFGVEMAKDLGLVTTEVNRFGDRMVKSGDITLGTWAALSKRHRIYVHGLITGNEVSLDHVDTLGELEEAYRSSGAGTDENIKATKRFDEIMARTSDLTNRQTGRLMNAMQATMRFGGAISKTTADQVGNLVAVGDLSGALKLLEEETKRGTRALDNAASSHETAKAKAADQEMKVRSLSSALDGIPRHVRSDVTADTSRAREIISSYIHDLDNMQIEINVAAAVHTRALNQPVYHSGGYVAGPVAGDIPAVLQEGEFVVNRRSAARHMDLLSRINKYHSGGPVHRHGRDAGGWIGDPTALIQVEDMRARVQAAARKAWEAGNLGAMYAGGGIVAVGRLMQQMGFSVGEHPAFGGVAPVHSDNSYHYRGRAVDVNWPIGPTGGPIELAKLNQLATWIRRNVSPIAELFWPYYDPVGGHSRHLHLAMAGGGRIEEPILGRGLRTGRSYSFGENGPEDVVPVRDHGGFRPLIQVPVNVYGHNIGVEDLAGDIDVALQNRMAMMGRPDPNGG